MTISPLGAGNSRRSFNITENKIELQMVIFIALLNAVGGSISFDSLELSRNVNDYVVEFSEMQDPYRMILKLKRENDK